MGWGVPGDAQGVRPPDRGRHAVRSTLEPETARGPGKSWSGIHRANRLREIAETWERFDVEDGDLEVRNDTAAIIKVREQKIVSQGDISTASPPSGCRHEGLAGIDLLLTASSADLPGSHSLGVVADPDAGGLLARLPGDHGDAISPLTETKQWRPSSLEVDQ